MLDLTASTLALSVSKASSAGAKPENQDANGALIPADSRLGLRGALFAVVDGISSSSQSGDAATTIVAELIEGYFSAPETWSIETAAKSVIAAINARLYALNRGLDDINKGHVATLSCLVLHGRTAHIFHVGDSRVQRFKGKGLEALTLDHTVEAEDGDLHLSRSVGSAQTLEIDYQKMAIEAGDIFVLSTDGVHDFIDVADVSGALQAADFEATATTLIDKALSKGSADNLTVQLVRVDHVPDDHSLKLSETLADLQPPAPLAAGDQLDGYTIIRQLHQSARSQLFLAKAADDTQLVIKIPASDILSDEKAKQRFSLESWVINQLESPHIIEGFKGAPNPTALYSVAAYFNGQDLRQWAQDQQTRDLTKIRAIADQIVTGLTALHRREILHQDLRPENIMINQDGLVKIIDLGSASVAGVEEAVPGLLGELAGTYQYTAPEYLSGDQVSWRSDQFALGVILYELLTGRLPYGQQSARVRNTQDQMRLTYQSARDEKSGIPIWMDQALQKATHPDPLRRYDALSEFLADLKRPRPGWNEEGFIPLADRNPVMFWKSVSLLLSLLCLALALKAFS